MIFELAFPNLLPPGTVDKAGILSLTSFLFFLIFNIVIVFSKKKCLSRPYLFWGVYVIIFNIFTFFLIFRAYVDSLE